MEKYGNQGYNIGTQKMVSYSLKTGEIRKLLELNNLLQGQMISEDIM